MATKADDAGHTVQTKPLETVSVRFCGDSGDGMQLTGSQFGSTSAMFGNDIATFPDYPAEIRAPKGTLFGVSGFQVQFSSTDIYTPGDTVNALVAMNPAGFKANIDDVEPGGIVIVNEDEFTKGNLAKCGYIDGYNPLDDDTYTGRYHIHRVPMTRLTRETLADSGLGSKSVDRCRNMFALGIVYWLFDRPMDATSQYLRHYFGDEKGKPEVADVNIRALRAGYYFGETAEMFPARYTIPPAKLPAGTYRKISGNEAASLGFVAASRKCNRELFYATYPITPATDILHNLARLKHFGVATVQAEDEIAAVCIAIGASYAGRLALTGTSGPGLALKGEGIGLAVMLELPLVVVNVQRAGPSTGMPTKTEQADLLQAYYGRSGECPLIIVAPRSPSDCFELAIEACRLAIRHMTPVLFLSDGYVANGAEPWRLPDFDAIEPIPVENPWETNNPGGPFLPYKRDPGTLARPWVLPGTPGLEHRIGGLEKEHERGNVSYDGENHDFMVRTRAAKVAKAADTIPPIEVRGPDSGDVLVLGWGGTYGAITTAGDMLREEGLSVSTAHLRYLNPMPANLGEVLGRFKRVVIPELNQGQLLMLIRSKFMIDAVGIHEQYGQMFRVQSLADRIRQSIQK